MYMHDKVPAHYFFDMCDTVLRRNKKHSSVQELEQHQDKIVDQDVELGLCCGRGIDRILTRYCGRRSSGRGATTT